MLSWRRDFGRVVSYVIGRVGFELIQPPRRGLEVRWNLALVMSLAVSGCNLAVSLDSYTSGNKDASESGTDTASEDVDVVEDSRQDIQEALDTAVQDVSETCVEAQALCRQGVLVKHCKDGSVLTIEDCRSLNRLCDADRSACVDKCRSDADCSHAGVADWEFCRADGRCASKVFETEWEIPEPDWTLVLPVDPGSVPKAACDFKILWGDEPRGTDFTAAQHVGECGAANSIQHRYHQPGRYRIKITGTLVGWGQGETGCTVGSSLQQLKAVIYFGPVGLGSGAFARTQGVRFSEWDVPDATLWQRGSFMFCYASQIDEAILRWDTSKVITMDAMFWNAQDFNLPIGRWDTGKVQNMTNMFSGALAFNQPLNSWNTSKVVQMDYMFRQATVFNQPLGRWDTSKVLSMSGMFDNAAAFDQDLSTWQLRWNVNLTNIFAASALSQTNYCAIAQLPGWRDKLSTLGVSFSCS